MRSSRLLLRTLLSGPLTGRRRPAECTGTAARWGEREGKSESGAMGTWGGGRVRKCVLLGERERGREAKVVVMMEPRERRRPPADERCEACRRRRVAPRART